MRRILCVDYANSFFSHFHFKQPDKSYLFINNIRNLADQFSVDKVIFACEGGKSKYRLNIMPGYKAGRAKAREKQDPKEQARYERFKNEELPECLELAKLAGIPCLQIWGVEADDIISFISRHIDTDQYQLLNLSTDGDMWSLLRPGVVQAGYNRSMTEPLAGNQRLPAKLWMNSKQFQEQYDITPRQFTDVLGLAGDASDSIVSPKGLGEGTALKLIQKYGSIDGVWNNIDNLDVPRMGDKVKQALKLHFCMVRRNMLMVDLHHTPEVEQQIYGEQGLAYLEQVLADLDTPGKPDVPALKEWFYECGKLNVVEKLDFWLQPFQRS